MSRAALVMAGGLFSIAVDANQDGFAKPLVLELYMDKDTKQIYGEPGKNRIRLGMFQQRGSETIQKETENNRRELVTIKNRLDAKEKEIDRKLEKVASRPADSAMTVQPAKKAWYEKLSLRGYTQMRMNPILEGNRDVVRTYGDSSVGKNRSFFLRRARLILSGDVSDNLYLYLQPDFASTPGGATTSNFAQLRDAYVDIFVDKKKEFRFRPGQSKIPFGFENLQSSQNRIPLDRADGLNTCCQDERDLGLFFYYTPEHIRPIFRDLVSHNLKGSGDYGVVAFGVYNGQGANRTELNQQLHLVGRFSYPYQFENGQVIEAGFGGYTGRYNIGSASAISGYGTPRISSGNAASGFKDQRLEVHGIVYPQPFGIQAEWNWGVGPSLNEQLNSIEAHSLNGGFVQATYKIEDHLLNSGIWFPFVRYQNYNGGVKTQTNAPASRVRDWEFGFEWQPRPELEFTMSYVKMNRTNVFTAPYYNFAANVLRMQLQWNY